MNKIDLNFSISFNMSSILIPSVVSITIYSDTKSQRWNIIPSSFARIIKSIIKSYLYNTKILLNFLPTILFYRYITTASFNLSPQIHRPITDTMIYIILNVNPTMSFLLKPTAHNKDMRNIPTP